MVEGLSAHRFTVDDFYKMVDVGILAEGGRFELLAGQVVEMAPEGPRHSSAIDRLADLFRDRARSRYNVRVQHPIRCAIDAEPEPDIALVSWREDYYENAHPTQHDVELLVEVAGASLAIDRGAKLALYASAGIREYWIVDLAQRRLHVYRKPLGKVYREHLVPTADFSPLSYPDIIVPLTHIVR